MKIELDSTNSLKKLKFRNIKGFNWQLAGTHDRKEDLSMNSFNLSLLR